MYNKTGNTFLLASVYHYDKNNEAYEVLSYFNSFHTYFTGFNKNRKNVYDMGTGKGKEGEFIVTSIAHRLFEENIHFFFQNIKKWETLQKSLKEV